MLCYWTYSVVASQQGLCIQGVLHCEGACVLVQVEWVGATAQLQAIDDIIVG